MVAGRGYKGHFCTSFRSIIKTREKQYFLHLFKILATFVPKAAPSLGRRANAFGHRWLGVCTVRTEVSFGVGRMCMFLYSHS